VTSPPFQPARSVVETARAVRSGELSASDCVRDALSRVRERDPALHAFLEVLGDEAERTARAIDDRRARPGDSAPGRGLGELAGVCLGIKDNLCLAWGRTTCASRILENYRSPFTATSVQRLLDQDAIALGKTNLDEFAMGSSCESSAFGTTRNPFDPSRVPGGSSGGSAAGVGAAMVPAALGSDTGGSIRQPAGWCNVVGLKPTYGRVSRYGLVAYASSLDQVGPMASCIADCALLSFHLCGHDPLDATSVDDRGLPPAGYALDHLDALERDADRPGLVVGVPTAARGSGGNHGAVNEAIERSAAALREAGATIVDVDLALLEEAIAAYYIIAPAEASSNLARFDGVRYGRRAAMDEGDDLEALYARSRGEGFGPEVQRRILLGTYVLSAGYADRYYHTAQKARRLIKDAYEQLLPSRGGSASGRGTSGSRACDVVLMPSSPGPAFVLGEKNSDPLALYLEDVYTVGVNLAGLPAMSVPAGFASVARDGKARPLPVGVQLVAPAFEERRLFRAGRVLERAFGVGAARLWPD